MMIRKKILLPASFPYLFATVFLLPLAADADSTTTRPAADRSTGGSLWLNYHELAPDLRNDWFGQSWQSWSRRKPLPGNGAMNVSAISPASRVKETIHNNTQSRIYQMKKSFKRSIALWLLAFLPLQLSVAEQPATKPNIVFIIADDLGYRNLGCYGGKRIQKGVGKPGKLALYDLSSDIGETNDLAGKYPDIAAKLSDLMQKACSEPRSQQADATDTGREEEH